MVPLWQQVVLERYPKGDDVNYWHEKRLINGHRLGLDVYEDLEELHGVNFLTEVIPELLARVKKEASGRKMKVLDIGSGLGLVTDQIRHQFGKELDVFGTSLAKQGSIVRKRRILKGLMDNFFDPEVKFSVDVPIHEQVSRRILKSLGRFDDNLEKVIHPNDAKFRSVLELTDYPEFDLEIDTYGELYYSNHLFPQVLDAALRKLRKGGRLYIADLFKPYPEEKNKFDQVDWFFRKRKDLSRKYGVEIMINDSEHPEEDLFDRGQNKSGVIISKFKN